jgi:predicted RNA-binding protein with PIN domain
MALLIDGYNLLHVTGIFGKGTGPGTFQRSREALLRFLAASLAPDERKNATVVFDAAEAPPGLPRTVAFDEMTVRYATGYPDADTLIEELIQSDNAPRSLLVVSSDHRIQRAARRRRAGFVDSDVWYADLWQRRARSLDSQQKPVPEKPMGDLSAAEIDHWVNEFSSDDDETLTGRPSPGKGKAAPSDDPIENSFPPGYGEDLLREDGQL